MKTQTAMPSVPKMTQAQMAEKIAQLEAQLASKKAPLSIRVSEKKAVMLLGVRGFPVTFYAGEWEKIFSQKDKIELFIQEHKSELAFKA